MIKGRKIYLEPFENVHLNDPDYLSWLRDHEVIRYIGREEYLEPIPFDEVREYVEVLWSNRFCFFFAMHSQENKKFIGTVKINFFNEQGFRDKMADIGIMIGNRDYWGKGIAIDALYTACRHAFDKLEARKLTAGAVAPNIAVIKAFLKIGFVEEGRLRNKVLVSGEYVDHVLMGCFENELKDYA